MAEQADSDRLVDVIAERVRARLGRSLPVVAPRDRGPCTDDSAEDCGECGVCVIRRPWSVRAVEAAGAPRVGAPSGVGKLEGNLARMIDHTLLRPDAARDDVIKLCQKARTHHFASVCVNSTWVPLAKALLAGSNV